MVSRLGTLFAAILLMQSGLAGGATLIDDSTVTGVSPAGTDGYVYQGTGLFIGVHTILTAAHVVSHCKAVRIASANGSILAETVRHVRTARSSRRDVALLTVDATAPGIALLKDALPANRHRAGLNCRVGIGPSAIRPARRSPPWRRQLLPPAGPLPIGFAMTPDRLVDAGRHT